MMKNEQNTNHKENEMNTVVKAIEAKESRDAKINQLVESRKRIHNMTLTTVTARMLDANTRALILATGFDRYQVKAIYG